jgi:putative acetyltransferase
MSVDKRLIIRRADPASPDCRVLIEELDRLQESLYPPENNYLDSIDELQKPNCCFLGAYLDQKIVGCGALRIIDGMYGEIKRMYVVDGHRQLGIGQRLLEELEVHSAESGVMLVRLETGVSQSEALALYRRNGYKETAAFGGYSDSALNVFMEKQLSSE